MRGLPLYPKNNRRKRSICIEGEEHSVRAAWTACLTEERQGKNLINEPKLWGTVIGKDEALKLIQTVSELEEELQTRLSDEAYSRIVFSLGFSLYRIDLSIFHRTLHGLECLSQILRHDDNVHTRFYGFHRRFP